MANIVKPDCRYFNGYKPCRFGGQCQGCEEFAVAQPDLLLINLDALGDVLRTTALLPAIRRAHPEARITWLTRPRAAALLQGNPDIDRVMVWDCDGITELRSRRFDLVLNADKSPGSAGLTMQLEANEKRGFGLYPRGGIVALNPEAEELFRLGLDDHAKFRVNQRTEQDLLAEALGFTHARDPMCLVLNPQEKAGGSRRQVGFNTGCSPAYPYKKLPLKTQMDAIRLIAPQVDGPILLLGGPEDAERNRQIAQQVPGLVELTPTDQGLRTGAAALDRVDVVVSGDSLGMHMAIALGKHVVAWFGPTCPQEIDLYDRGIKLLADVECAPCWRSTCDHVPMCHDRVEPDWIAAAVMRCLDARQQGLPLDEVWREGKPSAGAWAW